MTRHVTVPTALGAVVAFVTVVSRPAQAELPTAVDLGVTGAAVAGTILIGLVPVDTSTVWRHEPFGFDEPAKSNISVQAARLSDVLVAVTVASPLALMAGRGTDAAFGRDALAYAEALALNLLANGVVKYVVQRPRPYRYHRDPAVQRYAAAQGQDAHLSFYSGHASTAFAAAVAGAYAHGRRTGDIAARAAVWGVELCLAAATANLRVRAGKHFYSDVIVGALAGGAIGLAVQATHDGDRGYSVEPAEWAAMAGGIAAGILLSELLPLLRDVPADLQHVSPIALVPLASERGTGIAVRWRY